jgi:hypothetical protein
MVRGSCNCLYVGGCRNAGTKLAEIYIGQLRELQTYIVLHTLACLYLHCQDRARCIPWMYREAPIQAREAAKCADSFRAELCGDTYGRCDLFPIGKAVVAIKQTPPRECASCLHAVPRHTCGYGIVTNNGEGRRRAGPSCMYVPNGLGGCWPSHELVANHRALMVGWLAS